MTSFRTARRTVLAAVVAAAAFTAPAVAQAPPPPPASQGAAHEAAPVVRSGSPTSAVDRVADFYGAYIDALYDTGRNRRFAHDLRGFYLTTQYAQRLTTWEQTNHVDGVLRAQNVPVAWAVRYDNSAAGHVYSYVRLTWSGGPQRTYTYLSVRSDLATKKISDIKQVRRPSAGNGTGPQQNQADKPWEGPDTNSGSRPDGSRPEGNRPQGNRPQGNGPQGNRPQGDRPEGGRPDFRPGDQPDYQPDNGPDEEPMAG